MISVRIADAYKSSAKIFFKICTGRAWESFTPKGAMSILVKAMQSRACKLQHETSVAKAKQVS